MKAKCKFQQLEFQGFGRRKIIVKNDGEMTPPMKASYCISRLNKKSGIISRLSECFTESQEQYRVGHSLNGLLKQRIFGICQGNEDLKEHVSLRDDPQLQYVCGKEG